MDNRDLQRTAHIRAHCQDIARFIERFGNDFNAFAQDRALFFNAVSMSLLQIGESANGLSEQFRAETKEAMPWSRIRDMRNWLAHAYGETDKRIIRETAVHDMPELLDFCDSVLS